MSIRHLQRQANQDGDAVRCEKIHIHGQALGHCILYLTGESSLMTCMRH